MEAAACSLPSATRTCRRPCPSPRVSRASSRPCLLRPVAVSGAPLALNPNHPVGGGKPGGVCLHLLSSCPPAVFCAVAVGCCCCSSECVRSVHLWFGKWAFLGIKMGKVRICKCEGGNAPHSALLPRADGCMPREAPQRPAAAIFAVQMQAHLQIRAAHLQMRPAHHSAFVNARVHSLIL